METKTKDAKTNKMEKEKNHAFGKEVYLLGKNKDGERLWLEAASWDCGWYWGFGYIEVYTYNKRPDLAQDINSHSHWSGLVGKQEYYDSEKQCFRLGSGYIYHLNDNPDIVSVLTDLEAWELSDLMKSFYTLQATAELYHLGNSHLTGSVKLNFKDKEREDNINKILLPRIFERVYQILTPD